MELFNKDKFKKIVVDNFSDEFLKGIENIPLTKQDKEKFLNSVKHINNMNNKSDNKLKISFSKEELISNGEVYINKFKEIEKEDFTSLRKLQLEFMEKFLKKNNKDFYDGFVIFHRTITGYYPVKIAEDFIDFLKTDKYSEAVEKTKVLIRKSKEN